MPQNERHFRARKIRLTWVGFWASDVLQHQMAIISKSTSITLLIVAKRWLVPHRTQWIIHGCRYNYWGSPWSAPWSIYSNTAACIWFKSLSTLTCPVFGLLSECYGSNCLHKKLISIRLELQAHIVGFQFQRQINSKACAIAKKINRIWLFNKCHINEPWPSHFKNLRLDKV